MLFYEYKEQNMFLKVRDIYGIMDIMLNLSKIDFWFVRPKEMGEEFEGLVLVYTGNKDRTLDKVSSELFLKIFKDKTVTEFSEKIMNYE